MPEYNPLRKPEGEYLGVITSFSDKGLNQWEFGITLREDPSAVYPFTCPLTEGSLWKIRSVLLACAVLVPKGEGVLSINPASLIGREIGICLEDDHKNGPDGQEEFSVAHTFFPASEWHRDYDQDPEDGEEPDPLDEIEEAEDEPPAEEAPKPTEEPPPALPDQQESKPEPVRPTPTREIDTRTEFLFRRGKVHTILGDRASGKTWVALGAASKFLRTGEEVTWFCLNCYGREEEIACMARLSERLTMLGVEHEQRVNFSLRHQPTADWWPHPDIPDYVPSGLVVFDGIEKAPEMGLKPPPNKAKNVVSDYLSCHTSSPDLTVIVTATTPITGVLGTETPSRFALNSQVVINLLGTNAARRPHEHLYSLAGKPKGRRPASKKKPRGLKPSKVANAKYPWHELANGETREMVEGEDFQCSASAFAQAARQYARNHDLMLKIRVRRGVVTFRFWED